MPEINLDRLRELAGHLRNAVRELRAIGQTPIEAWPLDARSINSAKYLLIVAAEAALSSDLDLLIVKETPLAVLRATS